MKFDAFLISFTKNKNYGSFDRDPICTNTNFIFKERDVVPKKFRYENIEFNFSESKFVLFMIPEI